MATIFTRKADSGVIKYFGNITVNGKRIRRYLGLNKKTAELALKKLEYELLLCPPTKETNQSIQLYSSSLVEIKFVKKSQKDLKMEKRRLY